MSGTTVKNIDTLGFSPEEIEAMRAGIPLNGSMKRGLYGGAPDIKERVKTRQPNIKTPTGEVVTKQQVARVSPDLAKRLGDQAVAEREAERKAEQAELKRKEEESFPALLKRVSFLERKLKEVQKQLKEVSNAVS